MNKKIILLVAILIPVFAPNPSRATIIVYGSGGTIISNGRTIVCPLNGIHVCATFEIVSGANPIDYGTVLQMTASDGTVINGTVVEHGDADADGNYQGHDLVLTVEE